LTVTAPDVPPPVKPVPAVTAVISPTLIEPPKEVAVPLIVIEELANELLGTLDKPKAIVPLT
jgi:hypothetical protein